MRCVARRLKDDIHNFSFTVNPNRRPSTEFRLHPVFPESAVFVPASSKKPHAPQRHTHTRHAPTKPNQSPISPHPHLFLILSCPSIHKQQRTGTMSGQIRTRKRGMMLRMCWMCVHLSLTCHALNQTCPVACLVVVLCRRKSQARPRDLPRRAGQSHQRLRGARRGIVLPHACVSLCPLFVCLFVCACVLLLTACVSACWFHVLPYCSSFALLLLCIAFAFALTTCTGPGQPGEARQRPRLPPLCSRVSRHLHCRRHPRCVSHPNSTKSKPGMRLCAWCLVIHASAVANEVRSHGACQRCRCRWLCQAM